MIARHFQTLNWLEIELDNDRVSRVEPVEGPIAVSETDLFIAPAFWDIQVNGRWGVSFTDPTLTTEQVATIVRAQQELGTAKVCPTLITSSYENLEHGVRTIAAACEQAPEIAARVPGIHLEGPYISEVEGYRGAHPAEHIRDPEWDAFQQLQDASGGRISLVTLAPERKGSIAFIERATASGVAIALGHTAADGPTIAAAVAAGARLSTHLGNGIAAQLARHPNPIWHQAACDDLFASFIADGHHLDLDTLRVLVRAKTPARIILVSDASPLAGLSPGRYGDWAVDRSGKIVVAGTPYLAGSNQGLDVGLSNLMEAMPIEWFGPDVDADGDGSQSLLQAAPAQEFAVRLASAIDAVTLHPSWLLRQRPPGIRPGETADLVRFRIDPGRRIGLLDCCVNGQWARCRGDSPAPGCIPRLIPAG